MNLFEVLPSQHRLNKLAKMDFQGRKRSFAQALADELGGKWVYDRSKRRWTCDDGRYVIPTTSLVDDYTYTTHYHLYDKEGNCIKQII